MPRDQVRQLLEAIAGSSDAALYALELATGLREGEILGLRWAHDDRSPGVDLKRAEVRVHEQLQHGELVPLKRGARVECCGCHPHLSTSCASTTPGSSPIS